MGEDERELILYYLRILYSNPKDVELMDEQQDNINMIKRVVELDPILTDEDRNILTIAYKNAVTYRRTSLRDVDQCLTRETSNPEPRQYNIGQLTAFKKTLQNELEAICIDLIGLVNEKILSSSAIEPEGRVYYEKMKGDFYRYICESRPREEIEEYLEKGKQCYADGMEIGKTELSITSPTFLGLVLNYTVFLYEIMELKSEAVELSQKTFTETADLVDTMDDNSYSESSIILQLLRENYTRWIEVGDQGM